ncbi:MAG: DUF5615 family PIN-like protein [Candidatus Zixiibacteriota bacterium]
MRAEGYDVLWVRESQPGLVDSQVAKLALKEDRLLITFDKDFGDMIFQQGGMNVPGIILFRFRLRSPEAVASQIVKSLAQEVDWDGRYAVVTESQVRIVPLVKGRD